MRYAGSGLCEACCIDIIDGIARSYKNLLNSQKAKQVDIFEIQAEDIGQSR